MSVHSTRPILLSTAFVHCVCAVLNDSTLDVLAFVAPGLRASPQVMTVDDEKRSADGDAVDDRSPAQRAPFWRIMFLTWMYAIVRIAYGRSPRKLEEGDCFSLGIATDARHLSETWLTDLRRADAEAATYNAGLADGSIKPSWRQRVRSRILSAIGLRARDGRKTPGIMHLLLKTFGPRILGTCIAPLTLAMASNLAISLVLKARRP